MRSRRFHGIKFRRQQPLGAYIVDFCSLEEKLVIELDGGQHSENQAKDGKRTRFLQVEGFHVVRVWNNEVLANMESVLEYIRQQIPKLPSPHPSPLKGEGEKIFPPVE